MLIRFEASNFRSIHDPVELSMVAVDTERAEARQIPNLRESLLHVAAIFGPNASGKSNVIAALTWLRDAVRDSLRTWDDGIPVEPFAFAGGPHQPTWFTLESVIRGVRFEYVLELDRRIVIYEGFSTIRRRSGGGSSSGWATGSNCSGAWDICPVPESCSHPGPSRCPAAVGSRSRWSPPSPTNCCRFRLWDRTPGAVFQQPRAFSRRGVCSRTARILISLLCSVPRGTNAPVREAGTQALALLRLADPGIEEVVDWERWPRSQGNAYGPPSIWRRPTCMAGSGLCLTWTE